MWVNSKTAAVALGVSYETLKKSAQRAVKGGAFFCLVNGTKLPLSFVDGVGRGGKVLELDVPDALLAAAGLLEGLLKESGNGVRNSNGFDGGAARGGYGSNSYGDLSCEQGLKNGYGIRSSDNTGAGNDTAELVDGRDSSAVQQGGFGGISCERTNGMGGYGNEGSGNGGCGVATQGVVGLHYGYSPTGRGGNGTEAQTERTHGGNAAGQYESRSADGGYWRAGGSGREVERRGAKSARSNAAAGQRLERIGGRVNVGNRGIALDSASNGAGGRGADVVGHGKTVSKMISDIRALNMAGLDTTKAQAVREALDVPIGVKKMVHYGRIADKYSTSTPSLLRWMALASAKAPEVTTKRLADVSGVKLKSSAFDAAALEWAIGYKMNHKMHQVVDIYEVLKKEAAVQGWRIGSAKRLYAFFAKPEIKTLIVGSTQGGRALLNGAIAHVNRAWDSYSALGMVVGDQIVSDFEVVNPETGEIVTPEFYVFADMRSRAVIGMSMTLGKYNKYLIADAFKQVCEIGLPMRVYTDNGKPELSKYFADVQAQIKGVEIGSVDTRAIDYGHTRARVKNSRAKPIENIFNHIQRRLRVMVDGVGYHKRVDGDLGDMQAKRLKKDTKSGNLLMADAFLEKMIEAIEWWNTHLFSVNDSRRGRAPFELFVEDLQRTGVVRLSEQALSFMLLPRQTRLIRGGSVRVGNYDYTSPKLVLLRGETVEIRHDPLDLTRCWVMGVSDLKGEVIECKLNEAINANDWVALSDKLAEQTRLKNMVMSMVRKYQQVITGVKNVTKLSKLEGVARKMTADKAADAELKALLVPDLTKQVLKKKAAGG